MLSIKIDRKIPARIMAEINFSRTTFTPKPIYTMFVTNDEKLVFEFVLK